MTSQEGLPPVTARVGNDMHSSVFNINENSVMIGEQSLFNEPAKMSMYTTDNEKFETHINTARASGAVDLKAITPAMISQNVSVQLEEAPSPPIMMQDFASTI